MVLGAIGEPGELASLPELSDEAASLRAVMAQPFGGQTTGGGHPAGPDEEA
jgi:hypothetical protein